MKLILGDCLYKLKELDDNSVDSIVTDPPYGLSFMNKHWDYDVPSHEIWVECLRVLKPGGYLLAFAGSRTYHRMAVRIEDAGFEIRDQIMWIYGSGFPKSMDIGKALDKKLGNKREVVGMKPGYSAGRKISGGFSEAKGWNQNENSQASGMIATKGTSEWEGWGTALKPAHEPIVMARKPLGENTVVDNILKYGTGGINIDASRIQFQNEADKKESTQKNQHGDFGTPPLTDNHIYGDYSMVERKNHNPEARFPANIILDEEAGKLLDEQSGISKSSGGSGEASKGALGKNVYGKYENSELATNAGGLGDIGGASRFFYCPKTSKEDRNEGIDNKNYHPTVKPTDLMLYLIRMVTPPNGTTLDPFMGSGSTGKAAVRGGFDFVGIEREEEYMEIAQARIQYEIDNPFIEKGKRANKETIDTVSKFFDL